MRNRISQVILVGTTLALPLLVAPRTAEAAWKHVEQIIPGGPADLAWKGTRAWANLYVFADGHHAIGNCKGNSKGASIDKEINAVGAFIRMSTHTGSKVGEIEFYGSVLAHVWAKTVQGECATRARGHQEVDILADGIKVGHALALLDVTLQSESKLLGTVNAGFSKSPLGGPDASISVDIASDVGHAEKSLHALGVIDPRCVCTNHAVVKKTSETLHRIFVNGWWFSAAHALSSSDTQDNTKVKYIDACPEYKI